MALWRRTLTTGQGFIGKGFAALYLLAACGLAAAAEPEIRLVEQDEAPVAIEVTGLPTDVCEALGQLPAGDAGWPRTLAVYVGKQSSAGQPALSGRYELRESVLRFTPQYALRAGLSYRVEVFLPAPNRESAPSRHEKVIAIPAAGRAAPASVVAVFPSGDAIPENQLRFYLHFATPMSRGEAYDHLKLLKTNGEAVKWPFLEIGEELWDTSGTRLTLLIDPGRIKRGLRPREEDGPVLEAGGKYTLVVAQGWRDAAGQGLAEDYKKSFRAGPPIETGIDHKAWKIAAPPTGKTDPLVVEFDRPLDRALAERTITVAGPDGSELAGEVALGKGERRWQFRPEQPWTAGQHELVIDTVLEDGAGNRIGRPFEVDQFREIDRSSAPEFVRLPFKIGPAAK
jgi:hypothetical protein